MMLRRYWPVLVLGLFWTGCLSHVPPPQPVPPPPPPAAVSPLEQLTQHLTGTWEDLEKGKPPRDMIFDAGGRLTFKGGMEFFNPAEWQLRPDQNELVIRMPQVDVDKLQIFQMSMHDGLKAFHPNDKEIVYTFTNDTWSLNVGGWIYSKQDTAAPQSEEEPVLK